MNSQQNLGPNANMQSAQGQNLGANMHNYNAQFNLQQMQNMRAQQFDNSQLQMQQQIQQQNAQGQILQNEERAMRDNEKQIYTYESDWIIYALGFSWRECSDFRLAIGSLKEDLANEIRIIKLNEYSDQDFVALTNFDHQFPATKLLWIPHKSASNPDILATTSDYLRVWEVDSANNRVNLKSELKDASQQFCAPLTSFDWNQADPSVIGVCSLDTTCTIWDIGKESIKAQLIAHDKEVFDIGFQDVNVFATVGADGSMRMFDLRSLEHSTILYETNSNNEESKPLLRLEWNNQDSSYIATFEPDSKKIFILDIRVPMLPV